MASSWVKFTIHRVGWASELTLTLLVNLSYYINSSKFALFLARLDHLNVVSDCSWSSSTHSLASSMVSDSTWPIDHAGLIMNKLVVSHLHNVVINNAFFQRTAYVLNTDFPFRLLSQLMDRTYRHQSTFPLLFRFHLAAIHTISFCEMKHLGQDRLNYKDRYLSILGKWSRKKLIWNRPTMRWTWL